MSSYSIIQFRLIYDVAFALVMFSFGYTSLYLIRNREFNWKDTNICLPKPFFIVPFILNLVTIFFVSTMNFSGVGVLGVDILMQGFFALVPLLFFMLTVAANAIILYFNLHGAGQVCLYKLATYFLALVAVATCLSVYGFYIAGLEGIRISLLLLHVIFAGLSVLSIKRFKTAKLSIKIGTPDLLLIAVAIGIFALIFIPTGIYNLFGDNAVIPGSVLSIVNRGSLEPYFVADQFYSPILGFVSIVFSFMTGLDNILLACNLPFLVGSLLLPFVVYHFLNEFVTDNQQLAVLCAIAVSLMDGLAVVLLPAFTGALTDSTINFVISPRTASLYSSNICHLWIAPYKVFAVVCAIAACNTLASKKTFTFLLGGGLFFLSFINPRFSLLSIILLVFLIGLKRINIKSIGTFILGALILGGFALPVHLYKQLSEFALALQSNGIANPLFYEQVQTATEFLGASTITPFAVALIASAIVGLLILTKFLPPREVTTEKFAERFSLKSLPKINFTTEKIGSKQLTLSFDMVLAVFLLLLFAYIAARAYMPDVFLFVTSNSLLSLVDTLILRYHVLFAFFIFSLFLLRFNKQTALTVTLMVVVFCLGGLLTNSISILPLVPVILSLPLLVSLIKNQRRLITTCLLVLIFLGLFSSTLYSATTNETTRLSYTELSPILTLLIDNEPATPVYSPSYYTYFVDRITKMVHLQLSTDPNSSLYLIDLDSTYNTDLDDILSNNNFQTLYSGERFMLLKHGAD